MRFFNFVEFEKYPKSICEKLLIPDHRELLGASNSKCDSVAFPAAHSLTIRRERRVVKSWSCPVVFEFHRFFYAALFEQRGDFFGRPGFERPAGVV